MAEVKPDILYVDDEVENLVVFEATFENDFVIRTATSGEEALAILESLAIPVVVADQRMPGLSGVELCEILRQKHPHSKRIILTGHNDSEAMLDAINKGQVFHFLSKPWDRHVLLAVIRRALEAHELALANMALTERLVESERCATLGKMAAQVAHEMGNQVCLLPLLELIESEYSDCQDLVQMARFAADTHERLVALIEEIKTFVRFETHDIQLRPLPLAESMHELVSFLRFDKSIPQDRCTLTIKAEPVVRGNKIKLQQVLVNLLKNSADAIAGRQDGHIRVTVRSDGDGALVTVDDNGCGMSEETLAQIWRPFFSTKGREGNGLGLDVCRQIIEHHGGQIWCESTEQVGTTFYIRLPRIDQPAITEVNEDNQTLYEQAERATR